MNKNLSGINKKICWGVSFIGMVGAFLLCANQRVFAGSGSTPGGSGSTTDCKDTSVVCPEYGATWRWYPWPEGATEVYIDDNWPSRRVNSATIPGVKIVNGVDQGCAQFGGFYRYAIVAHNNAGSIKKGDQLGVFSIVKNADKKDDSRIFGGIMRYRTSNEGSDQLPNDDLNLDWESVRSIYLSYQAILNPSRDKNQDFWQRWGTSRNNSDVLSWFCGRDPSKPVIPEPDPIPDTPPSPSYDLDISFTADDGPIYSGETIGITDTTVRVALSEDAPDDAYVPSVPGIAKLIAYISNTDDSSEGEKTIAGSDVCSFISNKYLCREINSINTTFNASEYAKGSVDIISSFNRDDYNVFDANAGDYMCLVAAVTPSGIDNPNGWYVTAPQCRIIAKRPSFWAVGGDVYSSGSVRTSTSKKTNVLGFYAYDPFSKSNTTVFGSMAEHSTVILGTASGLASGAGTGYANKADHPSAGSFEGGNTNFCLKRATLSFANAGSVDLCPDTTGKLGIAPKKTDRKSLIKYWISGEPNIAGGGIVSLTASENYKTHRSASGAELRYTYLSGTGNTTLISAIIPKGVTHIVRTDGNITINDNISYANNNDLKSISDIPKLVIYAKNITINCHVTRVDAILMAEENVTTCPSSDHNSATNSVPLTINGAVITDTLTLNRTYGAAVGDNSGTPAELFNYDTTSVLWGYGMTGMAEYGLLKVIYQHELAPRY